jgi:hypothetical protein
MKLILNREPLKTPGPGSYDHNDPGKYKSATWKFGTDKLNNSVADYEVNGPGAYDLNYSSIEGQHHNGMFARNDRFQNQSLDAGSPGPGAYHYKGIPKAIDNMSKIGKEKRRDPDWGVGCTGGIGPGNYEVTQGDIENNKSKARGWTLRQRTN